MQRYRRLPLDGLLNARDLGGYPTKNGATRWGVFLRADVPAQLSPADIDFLRCYGLTMDIDLRSDAEIRVRPDALAGESWLAYRQISLSDRAASGASIKANVPCAFEEGFSWGPQYISMAENNKKWICEVLEALAAAPGPALYHCTTGKDRTGIVTAMLLGLCGVSDEDIAADYSVSQCYLTPLYMEMLQYIEEGYIRTLDAPFFSTAPENMMVLLEHLKSEYGGIPGFIDACGLSPEATERLIAKLSG